MDNAYLTVGRIVGFVGVAICILAAVVRLTGHYMAGSLSAEALFGGGTTAIVTGCFLLLVARTGRP
jgi:hypothetical protein